MTQLISDHAAVVTHAPAHPYDAVEYLEVRDKGPLVWTRDLSAATAFPSMREATRAALRLPGALRAFSLPLRGELTSRGALH